MTMVAGIVPPPDDKAWPRRWIVAGALVVFVHAGFLYWLVSNRILFVDEGAPPAAVMIDLAPLPVEPPAETPAEVPPEPEVVEPEPEPQETMVIPEPPVAQRPVAVLMPRPKPVKKVEKARPKPVERQASPSRAAATGAPSPGASASSGASTASWHSQVAAHIRRYKPGGAQERGTAVVSFTVDRSGHVLGARLASSSGSAALDRSALSMIHDANPVPAPPDDVAGSRFPFSVPVNFR